MGARGGKKAFYHAGGANYFCESPRIEFASAIEIRFILFRSSMIRLAENLRG